MGYIVLLFIIFYPNLYYASNTNFEVKTFKLCNQTQGLITFTGNITKEGNNQYLSYTYNSPIDLDDKIGLVCQILSNTVGKNFVELFTIREKNYCKAANSYLGEFWYDIERAAQLNPGVCPIRAGRYNVHRLLLNFNKITLQTFPFGRLRFIIRAVDNKNKIENVLCFFLEVENVFN